MALINAFLLFFFFPELKLTFFAPPIILAFYHRPLIQVLILALGIGLFLDASSPESFFGIHTCITLVTTFVLYQQKQHFFEDSLTTLPILTFFFAIISTLLHMVLLFIFDTPPLLSKYWAFTDLLAYPAIDAFYALIAFTLPEILRKRLGRRQSAEEEE